MAVHSSIHSRGNLAEFYQNHPTRHNLEELLIGLRVQSIETSGSGTITELIGTIGEQREDLIVAATGSTSKQALREAPDDQPVVGVKFGKNKTLYRYAMAALRPCITEETADKFDVQYGKLLRSTKIPYQERQALLTSYKHSASETLAEYGFQLERGVNSRNYPPLFWQPAIPIEQTPLLFGNGFTGVKGQILKGLTSGGVYRRHPDYQLESIKIAALKLCDSKVDPFLSIVQQRLKRYKFESEIIERKAFSVSNLSGAAARAELERVINQLATLSPDIVLILLPTSDRSADNDEGGSLYNLLTHNCSVVGLLVRLSIQEQGHPATIEQVVEATLKLTLLHHGALKAPRLPMPIYGADRMAYLKLNGIYLNIPEGDRQFWL